MRGVALACFVDLINTTDNHCLLLSAEGVSLQCSFRAHTQSGSQFLLGQNRGGCKRTWQGFRHRVVEHHCVVCMDSFLNCIETVRLGHDEANVKFKGCPGSSNVRSCVSVLWKLLEVAS